MDIINWANASTLKRSGIAIGDKFLLRDVSVTEESAPGGIVTMTLAELLQNQVDYPTTATAIGLFTHTALLSRAGAIGAYTLAAPTAAEAGVRITFTATTAYAHTITAPSAIIHDGVTGGGKTVITLAAFVGGSVTVEAVGVTWHIIARSVGTAA